MTEFLNDWGLTAVTFVQLVGALVMMLIPRDNEGAHKQISLGLALSSVRPGGLEGKRY